MVNKRSPRQLLIEKCLELLSDEPNLNSTQLAHAIVPNWNKGDYPAYNKTVLMINELRRTGAIPKGDYENNIQDL